MKNLWIAMAGLFVLQTAAMAQEGVTNSLKTTLSLGLSMTDGNSETMQGNASLVTEGEDVGLGSFRAGLEANYGESTVDGQEEKTIDNARVFGNVKKTMNPRTFGYLDGVALYDDIARIDYRFTLSPGLGVYWVKNGRTSLLFEAGPAYVWEKVDGVANNYFAVRVAERFEHAISPTAKLWQSTEYLPEAEDFNNYLMTSEVGIEAAINSHMKLRLVFQDKYDSMPGEGLEKNDYALIAGLAVSL